MIIYHDKQNIGLFNKHIICIRNVFFFVIYLRRPENIRRHVIAAPNRTVQSTTNNRTRPLKKATSVQRKSRQPNSTKSEPKSSK
jgi:hypothetical protein